MFHYIKLAIPLGVACILTSCATAHREVNSQSTQISGNGYVLVTIRSDMQGVLPLKPDSFWGVPAFLTLVSDKSYLLQMKAGGYSFGGLTVGTSIGWGTYSNVPFTVAPGKVVYLGEHRLQRTSGSTYSWEVRDALDEAIRALPTDSAKEIAGLPIERAVPSKK